MRSTGSPSAFAKKLGISRSSIFQDLQEMRELGLEIKYSPTLESYYYENGKRIQIATEKDNSSE
jgi:biotin operon repressor